MIILKDNMILKAKRFEELTTKELYELLKIRSEIFVVEQNCIYQDLDNKDYESLHVFYEENERVIAYLRAFWKNDDTVQIGRVLTANHGTGLGGILLNVGIEIVSKAFSPKHIYIEAQCYAIGFYERAGFKVCSDEFLEDGIPHVQMILDL